MRLTAFLAFLAVSTGLLSAADPVLVNLVMPDAKIMSGVNVTKAKISPFGQFLLLSLPADAGLNQFVSTTGFDPRQDLQEVLMASNGTAGNRLILGRGQFNPAKIAAAAVADGKGTTSIYNGAQLILPKAANSKEAMAFLLDGTSSTIALAGDVASVKAAIDRRNSANSIDVKLSQKLATYGATDAWTASIVPLSSLKVDTGSSPLGGVLKGDLLQKVQSTSGSITLSSQVAILAEAITDTDANATALGDVVKFLASMIQMQGGNTAVPVSTLLKSLNITTDHNTLKVDLTIPEDQLESLVKLAESQTSGKRNRI